MLLIPFNPSTHLQSTHTSPALLSPLELFLDSMSMSINGVSPSFQSFRPPTLPLPVEEENPFSILGESRHVLAPPHWKKAAEALQCGHFDEVCGMVSQFAHAQTVDIQGTALTVAQVTALARGDHVRVALDEEAARGRVTRSADWVAENISRGTDTYGVTTGFGATSHRRTNKTADLQTELIRFLNAGVIGKETLPASFSKAAMLVRANTLMQGYSGIRWEILEAMAKLINLNLIPKLPLRGTITASGDLVPLSYIAGVLTGRHNSKVVTPEGEEITAMEALKRAGIEAPFQLQAKEGLALVNGTAVGSAVASTVCFDANLLGLLAEVLSALFCDLMNGKPDFTDPLTHSRKTLYTDEDETLLESRFCEKELQQVVENLPVFSYIDDPTNPSYTFLPQLRDVLVERALKDPKSTDSAGYSIFKRIPIFQEELKERLIEEISKARERFDNGDFPVPNRIKKCRTYPIYGFVRKEVGTKLLSGENKVSPGEDIEKVYEAINDGKLGDMLMKCLAFWKGKPGPFTPRPSGLSSPAQFNPEYWGWFEKLRSPSSASNGRVNWDQL
eukprot:XP_010656485.1 PREDICTED: phenylalanine ammonia-lyase-like [Vitis vinifera]